MKFEKFMFDFLCDKGVARYTDGEKYKLVVENVKTNETLGSISFETYDEYRKWIDNVVDDETATYNRAQATNLLINAIID